MKHIKKFNESKLGMWDLDPEVSDAEILSAIEKSVDSGQCDYHHPVRRSGNNWTFLISFPDLYGSIDQHPNKDVYKKHPGYNPSERYLYIGIDIPNERVVDAFMISNDRDDQPRELKLGRNLEKKILSKYDFHFLKKPSFLKSKRDAYSNNKTPYLKGSIRESDVFSEREDDDKFFADFSKRTKEQIDDLPPRKVEIQPWVQKLLSKLPTRDDWQVSWNTSSVAELDYKHLSMDRDKMYIGMNLSNSGECEIWEEDEYGEKQYFFRGRVSESTIGTIIDSLNLSEYSHPPLP